MENKNVVNKKEIVKKLLKQEIDAEDEADLIEMLIDRPITIDVDKQEDKSLTIGEKLADKLSEVAGSWTFIIGFSAFIIIWIVINVIVLQKAADPYPFVLLNLMLSCLASLQAPIIMMSQNRQAKKDSIRNQNDYQIDLKSELILERLHEEIQESLRNERQIIKMLTEMQEEKNDNKK
ncbi:MAG: DUF1003 domain-containing protein [Bacilli bacterium]|nr:DUF1003 domain-containing protein [Bacilli bacterium]